MTTPQSTLEQILELEKKAKKGPWTFIDYGHIRMLHDHKAEELICNAAFKEDNSISLSTAEFELIALTRNHIGPIVEELLVARRVVEAVNAERCYSPLKVIEAMTSYYKLAGGVE